MESGLFKAIIAAVPTSQGLIQGSILDDADLCRSVRRTFDSEQE
ncbi:hypothetical protein [Arcanobacterium bovis]|nr:hypothetical protein [Arcanobacterium bovis]